HPRYYFDPFRETGRQLLYDLKYGGADDGAEKTADAAYQGHRNSPKRNKNAQSISRYQVLKKSIYGAGDTGKGAGDDIDHRLGMGDSEAQVVDPAGIVPNADLDLAERRFCKKPDYQKARPYYNHRKVIKIYRGF